MRLTLFHKLFFSNSGLFASFFTLFWLTTHNAEQVQLSSTLAYCVLGFGVFFAALINYFLARHITNPLQLIEKASKELSNLNFKTRSDVRRNDEIGELSDSINHVAKELLNFEIRQKHWLMDISHELRTPLTILIGEMEAISDGIYPCSIDGINSLKDEVQQIKRLVDDLHELTIMNRVGFKLDCLSFEILDFMQHQFSRYEGILKSRKITPSLELPQSPVYLMADANRLAQVIQNLLENCCRYVSPPGEVHIAVSKDDKYCHINCNDTGPGVSEDALTHLFDPLFRVDNSRNRKTGGAGLGLAICRNIISAHGGSITAHKSNLGGLCITIEIPLRGETV